MAFECRLLGVVRLSIIGRFVFLESAIFRRFVWDFSEIWICGLYLHCDRTNVYKIFQKSSIDSSMLYRISCILGYDFFTEYTQSFDKGVAKKSTKS